MAKLLALAAVLALACGHHILQLSEENVPLHVASPLFVQVGKSECAGDWGESTIGGWFSASSPSNLPLLSVISSPLHVFLSQAPSGQVEALVGRKQGPAITLRVGAGQGWNYVSLALSRSKARVELCVAPWQGKMECVAEELPKSFAAVDWGKAKVTFGKTENDFSLDVLDVFVTSVALSALESEGMSRNSDMPAMCHGSCYGPGNNFYKREVSGSEHRAVCTPNGLRAVEKYKTEDLWMNYEWDFGFNMFWWDSYDYGVNFSTVKVVIDISEVWGDPDIEVYQVHTFSANEYIGKSDKEGPDSLTIDWNWPLGEDGKPKFADGMDLTTTFRVYVTSKGFWTWYSMYFTFYSENIVRESSGRPLYAMQKMQKVGGNLWTLVALGGVLAVASAAMLAVRRRRSKQAIDQSLLDSLVTSKQD